METVQSNLGTSFLISLLLLLTFTIMRLNETQTHTSSSISVSEVSALYHKLFNDTMELAPLVAKPFL